MSGQLLLTIGDRPWRLPLCASTARALEAALLCAEVDQRAARIAALLPLDPALTLWCVVQLAPYEAAREDSQSAAAGENKKVGAQDWQTVARPLSIERLSKLVAQRLSRLLADSTQVHWNAPADVSLAAGALADENTLAQTSAAGSALALVAGELATARGLPAPDAVYLSSLACSAAGLLADANGAAAGKELTSELAELLLDVAGLPDLSSTLAELAERRDADAKSAEAADRLFSSYENQAASALAHWQAADAAAHEALARLAARLAPLESLESEFAARLEEEKLSAMKELAYGAGHEINNPLANISVRAQTLLKQERDPERRRTLAAINAQVFRAHEMIADLMLFARPPRLTRQPTNLVALLEGTLKELHDAAEARGTELIHVPATGAVLAAVDPVQIGLALHAMCANSLEAIGHGGHVEIAARPRRAARGDHWVEIVVTDDGPGISPEVRRHLFDPFYSGREAGRGLGFGLSKCWRIVREHGGQIAVESSLGHGARFTIQLPAA